MSFPRRQFISDDLCVFAIIADYIFNRQRNKCFVCVSEWQPIIWAILNLTPSKNGVDNNSGFIFLFLKMRTVKQNEITDFWKTVKYGQTCLNFLEMQKQRFDDLIVSKLL